MKSFIRRLSVVLLFLPVAAFSKELQDLDLYLLIGQSNMAGRASIEAEDERVLPGVFLFTNDDSWEVATNPINRFSTVRKQISMQRLSLGFSFAEWLSHAEPDRFIGLISNARGGTRIEEWAPGEELYVEAMERAKAAQKYGTIRGILWHQGEGNSRDPDYLEKFAKLVEGMRNDLGDPELPVVVGQVEGTRPINALLAIVSEAVPGTAVALSTNLTTYDGTHFDSESLREFGRRYAVEMAKLRGVKLPETLGKEGSISLFDGESLEGWEGNRDLFRIEDGAIVGGDLENPAPQNEFLCTTEEFGDFELEIEFKLVGSEMNSGVQFRSQRVPDSREVSGYQADLGNPDLWGSLYDESRRNRLLAASDPSKVETVLNRDGWNHYRIRAEGPRIQIWINGLQTVDFTEREDGIAERGIIGLQIHGASSGEAWFRNISLRELDTL